MKTFLGSAVTLSPPALRATVATLTAAQVWALAGALVLGCGGGSEEQERRARVAARSRSASLGGTSGGEQRDDRGRCDASQANREESEYDTSGDDVPDVRKVFLRVGSPPVLRLVLICREADLNGDGTKDVVRYYSDAGRPLREEADRNFDGRMDELTVFEDGRVVRLETDSNGDGNVDAKVFYERGRPNRIERDLSARSTATVWRPDRWEYYEEGRIVRMGTDLDGDGRVDRWDRDQIWQRSTEEARARDAARDFVQERREDEGIDSSGGGG